MVVGRCKKYLGGMKVGMQRGDEEDTFVGGLVYEHIDCSFNEGCREYCFGMQLSIHVVEVWSCPA